QIVSETPGAILANQFYNQVNPEAHYQTTGPEIWEQTEGRVTHFVTGAGIGGDKIPTTVWFDWIDEFRQVSDKTSFTMARRVAREEGILLGGSAGLNVAISLDLARQLDDPEALIVTILCDTGERYLSKQFNDAWMQENQMLETPRTTVQQLLERRPANAPAVVSVAPAAAVRQALTLMSTWGVSQIPVLENGQSVGGLIEG